ncbi:hypothetical protein [Haloechinothrix sp. LS1_15]|uniref:hypothetical protein n=1 Tax=Haloechinothrix sp. LS1_15 TaxID=2652248 RepID=UPI0029451C1F|nr:hypothetical protein [Haloechinothrix sp. LS1_15]MDV6013887.1 hypothetical protein [Haloechinothrix sp. LS1_15]
MVRTRRTAEAETATARGALAGVFTVSVALLVTACGTATGGCPDPGDAELTAHATAPADREDIDDSQGGEAGEPGAVDEDVLAQRQRELDELIAGAPELFADEEPEPTEQAVAVAEELAGTVVAGGDGEPEVTVVAVAVDADERLADLRASSLAGLLAEHGVAESRLNTEVVAEGDGATDEAGQPVRVLLAVR